MGINLPAGNRESLEWLEGRIATWNANSATIGLTSAQVLDIAGDIANARGAFTSVQDIRAESKSKTLDWTDKATALHTKASQLIATIKGFAASSGNASAVYVAADLSPKDPPSPAPAPATPSSLKANLNANGSIDLAWVGSGPTGTLYEVYRKLDGETTFDLLGNVDAQTKEYNDATLPVGATFATYMIRAVRAEKSSANSTQFNIQFGPTAPDANAQAA